MPRARVRRIKPLDEVFRDQRTMIAKFPVDRADELCKTFGVSIERPWPPVDNPLGTATLGRNALEVFQPEGLRPVLEAVAGEQPSLDVVPWKMRNPGEHGFLGPHISPDALQLVAATRQGIIGVHSMASRSQIIAQLIATFAGRRMAFLSSSTGEVKTTLSAVRALLSPQLQTQIAVIGAGADDDDDITVYWGTGGDLARISCNPKRPLQLIVWLDANHILQRLPQIATNSYSRARVFGFTVGNKVPAWSELDQVEVYFGFDWIRVLPDGESERFVQCEFHSVHGGHRIKAAIDGKLLLDQGIVGHDARNKLITRIACEHFESHSTVIVAANLRHAITLAKRLPKATIVRDRNVIPEWIPKTDHGGVLRKIRREMNDPTLKIVPLGDLEHASLDHAEAVLYAAGSHGVAETFRQKVIPGNCLRMRPAVVIDFRDLHNPQLKRDSLLRQKSYKRWGWTTDDLVAKRVAEFYSRRECRYEPA